MFTNRNTEGRAAGSTVLWAAGGERRGEITRSRPELKSSNWRKVNWCGLNHLTIWNQTLSGDALWWDRVSCEKDFIATIKVKVAVGVWLEEKWLRLDMKLNNDKTEALVVGSHRRASVSQVSHLRVGSHDICFKSHVKSLGVYSDATLSMAKHIDPTEVVQHISRSEELALFTISWQRKPLLGWCVL